MIYTPFCLPPKMTTMQALTLDYVLALYQLVLLDVGYMFVELHYHGFRLTLRLWKPFHSCFSHFRRQWDIRTILIDAFATLLPISYIKCPVCQLTSLFPPLHVHDIMCTATFADCTSISGVLGIKPWL